MLTVPIRGRHTHNFPMGRPRLNSRRRKHLSAVPVSMFAPDSGPFETTQTERRVRFAVDNNGSVRCQYAAAEHELDENNWWSREELDRIRMEVRLYLSSYIVGSRLQYRRYLTEMCYHCAHPYRSSLDHQIVDAIVNENHARGCERQLAEILNVPVPQFRKPKYPGQRCSKASGRFARLLAQADARAIRSPVFYF